MITVVCGLPNGAPPPGFKEVAMPAARCSRDVRIPGTETIADGSPSRREEHTLRQRHRTAGTAELLGVLCDTVCSEVGSRDPAVSAWHLARAAVFQQPNGRPVGVQAQKTHVHERTR